MTTGFNRKTLRDIAKKTLGRDPGDERPISTVYLAHLKHFLAAHPDEQDFLIDLDTGDGAVFCRVCERQLPHGTGEPEEDGKDVFGSINNFEEHLKTSAHCRRKALGSRPSLPIANTPNLTNAIPGPSAYPNSCHIIDLTSSPSTDHSYASPSTIVAAPPQGIDEDFLLALKLNDELNGPSVPRSPEGRDRKDISFQRLEANERLGDVAGPSRTDSSGDVSCRPAATQDDEESEEEFPFEETYHAQIQGILSSAPDEDVRTYLLYRESRDVIQARCQLCHFSVELPGSGSFDAKLGDVLQGVTAYEEHLKSAYHSRKRIEAASQTLGGRSQPMPTAQSNYPSPGALSTVNQQVDNGNTTKRKFPGSWNGGSDVVAVDNLRLSNPFGNRGFTSASELHRTYNSQMQQRGPGMEYRALPLAINSASCPQMCAPNDPVTPLSREPNKFNDGFDTRSARDVARDIASRRFHESRAAAFQAYGSYRGSDASDFNINYDEAGPVGNIDMSGLDLDKRFQDFIHKALEEFKDVTTVTDAQKKLKLQTENDLLDGMSVPLLPHQIIGVAWMVDQENDKEKLGGILADAMGLGKTVQMIATMALNRPPVRAIEADFFESRRLEKGKDREVEHVRRSTLILAPASLLQQWYEEFDDKTEPGIFRVHIHHGKDKLKTAQEIEDYDVIVASHQSVIMDFPKEKKKSAIDANDEDNLSDMDVTFTNRKTLGPLARVQWLRVIIDEAQSIRNRSTRISMCVAKLDSRYRWCLTGTPITNTLADIYGLLRFCRFAPWNDWKLFNDKIGKVQKKHPVRAGQKAQAILRPHLLRRTKDSTLDGRPIIRLGPKVIDMIELEFTPEEREIYTAVETSQKKVVSRFLKEGTVMKNYSFILIMILRLRQLCCHPSLATVEAESEEITDEKQKSELARAKQLMSAQKVKDVQERFKARILHRMKAELHMVEPEEDDCAICMEPIVENRRVTSCTHEFCSVCINEVLQKAEGGSTEEGARCPLCRAILDKSHIFVGKVFEPSADELEELGSSLPRPSGAESERPPKKSRIESLSKDGVIGDTDFENSTKDTFEPSTKMRQMLEAIVKWKAECPGDKTIVYSQWTSMLDLVEAYFKRSGIDILRYDGRMNRLARVESIARFKKPTGPSVMLVSLKCGGVGLNLTVANRVINLDLAWNYATEAQAYDRVHRLGQQKPVDIHRLIIRDTIEERIIRLQARKQGLSDAALGEGTGNKIQRMTARDIAQLFDLV